jgi:hypothetical protein
MSYYHKTRNYYEYIYDMRIAAYRHLMFSFILATLIVIYMINLGIEKIASLYLLGAIGELFVFFYLFFARITHKKLNEVSAAILLYTFVVCSSVTLSLVIYLAFKVNPVMAAGALTACTIVVIFAYLSSYRVYKHIPTLTKIVTVLIEVFFAFIFIGYLLLSDNPYYYLFSSLFSSIIWAIYLFIDFSRLENRDFRSPAIMALWVFFDLVYLLKESLWGAVLSKE